jgi:hypothetical protein
MRIIVAQATGEIILNQAKCFSRARGSSNNEKLTFSGRFAPFLPEFVTKMQLLEQIRCLIIEKPYLTMKNARKILHNSVHILAIAFLVLVGCRPQPNEPEIFPVRFAWNSTSQWNGEDCASWRRFKPTTWTPYAHR